MRLPLIVSHTGEHKLYKKKRLYAKQAQLSSDKPQFWLRFWLVIYDNLEELLIWAYPENLVKIGLLV